ncbi:MAG: toll/interleukin-1 receptor domain-containing protein, partial [bacterium]|nr:toll/interleukin-1 receptor domain-containing protein [bacterium]
MPSVFLSHSSADKPFVRELYRRLTRDGVDCFYDEESIEWGDNFVLTLEKAINQCDFLVVVLSPNFIRSKWAQLERTSATPDKIRPLLLEACEIPQFLQSIHRIDVSTDELFEKNYQKICTALGGTLRPDPEPRADCSTLPPVTPLPTLHRMPHRSLEDRFIGRVAPLWSVYDQLSGGATAVVHGIGVVHGAGGLGKSQLATEYVHRFNLHYPGGVFWVEADQGLSNLI